MTSKELRQNPLFLRNGYDTDNRWDIPVVRRQEINLAKVELIACSDTKANDLLNCEKGVHFFVDDIRFEGVYNNPEKTIAKYKQYAFVITPDFSEFSEMPQWEQINSVGKNRWCGAYWHSKGLKVICSVSWGLQSTYEFCFSGVEKGSTVAIGMIGCKSNRRAFVSGYNEMLRKIEPSAIICFGKPFPEMQGKIIAIDYGESRKVAR